MFSADYDVQSARVYLHLEVFFDMAKIGIEIAKKLLQLVVAGDFDYSI
jgi:hypothetical protein